AEERPEEIHTRVIAGGAVDHRRQQVEHDEDDERGQEELAEEPLVEAPGLTEHVTDPHACGRTLLGQARGRSSAKVEPRPGSDSTVSLPSIRSASSPQM